MVADAFGLPDKEEIRAISRRRPVVQTWSSFDSPIGFSQLTEVSIYRCWVARRRARWALLRQRWENRRGRRPASERGEDVEVVAHPPPVPPRNPPRSR